MDQAYLLAIKIYKLLSNLENVLPSSSTFKANASPTQHPTLNTLSLAIDQRRKNNEQPQNKKKKQE